MQMEARTLASELLVNCGVFWYQLESEIEEFHLHLVKITYGNNTPSVGKEECWTVGLTMMRVIWQDLRKVRVESETLYGSDDQKVMVGQYL